MVAPNAKREMKTDAGRAPGGLRPPPQGSVTACVMTVSRQTREREAQNSEDS